MLAPVGFCQIGIPDGTAAVQHVIPADIDTDMRNAVRGIAHGAFKEHQITGLCLFRRNLLADAVQVLLRPAARYCTRPIRCIPS